MSAPARQCFARAARTTAAASGRRAARRRGSRRRRSGCRSGPSSRRRGGSRGCGPARRGRRIPSGGAARRPGRPSSTASSAAARRCRPRPRRRRPRARRRARGIPRKPWTGFCRGRLTDYRSLGPPAPERPAMPPIAILSDIHGNRQALDATLRAAREAGARRGGASATSSGTAPTPRTAWPLEAGAPAASAATTTSGSPARSRSTSSPTSPARDHLDAETLGRGGPGEAPAARPADPDGEVPMFHGARATPSGSTSSASSRRARPSSTTASRSPLGHTHVPFAWALTTTARCRPSACRDGGGWTSTRALARQPGSVGSRATTTPARPGRSTTSSEAVEFRRTPYDVAGPKTPSSEPACPPCSRPA